MLPHSEAAESLRRFQLSCPTTDATKRPGNGPALIRQLDDRVVVLVRAESQAAFACADERRTRLGPTSLGQDSPKETTLLALNVHSNDSTWTGGPSPKGEQGYDIRDDQALPSLQTAINQKSAHRHRTVRLRKARLAGVVP